MKNIKFRVFNKAVSRIFFVTRLMFTGSSVVPQYNDGASEIIDLDVEDIMMCTGLEDADGVSIWEGDIVRIGDTTSIFIVRYVVDRFVLVRPNTNYCVDISRGSGARARHVIGNIYENPELLK